MGALPEIVVTTTEELFTDRLGQRWSPATIRVFWEPDEAQELRAPVVTVQVIALARKQMTAEELRQAHIGAARDVLRAALLAL
ncbi:MAG TPA: hypothetical protein VHG27_04940 [Xanthobacteraceae bacterium]|nr:hypothetical protein [Xanthobacteraceae bacterium]